MEALISYNGGGDEIRTHDRFNPMPAFQASALNRSATPPHYLETGQTNLSVPKIQVPNKKSWEIKGFPIAKTRKFSAKLQLGSFYLRQNTGADNH